MFALSNPSIFLACLLVLGLFAGLIAGLFGVGGGMIIVPVLVILFKSSGLAPGTAMHVAIGISMTSVVVTSLASMRAHFRYDAIETTIVKNWGPVVVVAATLGSLIAAQMRGAFLGLIFSVFLAVMAAFLGLLPPHLHSLKVSPSLIVQKILAFFIGFFSSLVGIGGGSLSVPALMMCRVPIHNAIGTSSVIGVLVSLPTAIVFLLWYFLQDSVLPLLSNGRSVTHMALIAVMTLVPTTMLTAPLGAKLAHQLPATKLRQIFAGLLAIIAIKMLLVSTSM